MLAEPGSTVEPVLVIFRAAFDRAFLRHYLPLIFLLVPAIGNHHMDFLKKKLIIEKERRTP